VAAGRRGLEEALAPTPAAVGDAATSPHRAAPFPLQFEQSIANWRTSAFAREIFGEAFVEAYAESRDWQLALLRNTVTDFDLRQFGECV